jgi:hypothetical protein
VTEDNENFLPDAEESERPGEARPFAIDQLVTCEECLRANPPTRLNCLYCGAGLPLSETANAVRVPTLRPPEKWEEGYNVILDKRAKMTEALLRDVAGLLKLEREAARHILGAEEPLPLARLHSAEEAQLIAERLRALTLNVLVVSDSDLLIKDGNRRRVRALEFTEHELVAFAAGSSEAWRAGWSELTLLVRGRIVVRRIEMEERRKAMGSEIVEARELAGDVLLLDLYTRARDGGWRIASDSFDFSCLGKRKGLLTAQNFASLVEVLRERAPEMMLDDSYNSLRQALAPVWPPEERTESRGLRRERPGRFNVEAVMTSDNEQQFTRYSRLRHFLRLPESEQHQRPE